MTIFEFADSVDKKIDINYHPNQNGRFSAQFVHAELKDGSFLRSIYGNGKTCTEAINNYIKQISNKKIVFSAYGEDGQEFIVPELDIVNNGS